MANKKDRIMDLMRRGIITEEEALELLEKSGLTDDAVSTDKAEKSSFTFTDKEGYVNHNVDFPDAMKNVAGSLFSKGKELFQGAAKAVDDNFDFSKGFPKVKSIAHHVEKDIEGDFDKVNLDVKAGKVTVLPGDNAHVKVDYKVYGAIEGGDVEAYLAEKSKLEVVDGTLEITTGTRVAANIELYLPAKDYDTIELSMTHSEIKVEKIAVNALKIAQINGTAELSALTADKIELTNKNGEIKVLDGKTNALKVDGVNGNIRVTTVFESGEVNLVNGNILITEATEAPRKLNVKNVNGDIKVSVPETLGLVGHVRTIFGGYKTRLKLDTPFEAGRNGAAVVRQGAETLTFELETKSGTIWLKDGETDQAEN